MEVSEKKGTSFSMKVSKPGSSTTWPNHDIACDIRLFFKTLFFLLEMESAALSPC